MDSLVKLMNKTKYVHITGEETDLKFNIKSAILFASFVAIRNIRRIAD